MKKKLFLAAGIMAALLSACQQNEGGMPTMPVGATAGDSLLFYLGELSGTQFKNMALTDTTLSTDQAKNAYLAGVQAGINLPKAEDAAYNQGLQTGMMMGANIVQFNKLYGLTLNNSVFLSSIKATVLTDSAVNSTEAQREFQRLMMKFQQEKEEQDKALANETLAQAVSGKDLTKINDDLYGKVTEKNDSAEIKDGDMVKLDIQVTTLEGQPVAFNAPLRGRVGAPNLRPVFTDALKKQRSGETGEYFTTAYSLFGARAEQMGYDTKQVLCFNLKASLEPTPKPDEKK